MPDHGRPVVMRAIIILIALTGCVSGTQGSFEGPLCAGQPITLTFNDRTDRQEGISAGCSRTHPDGTVDEVWILTGPKSTSPVAQVDAATLGMLIGAAIEAGKRAAVP